METTVVWLQPAAPRKPAEGAPCNGCGLCCAAEPCPLGILLTRRLRGRCAALTWDEAAMRYHCGAVTRSPAPLRRLVLRWIGAAQGCDSSLAADGPD
ncbi:MAG: hypothetical protein JNN18_08700 [Rubrivivax sp.]|jgi:predicted molibdopterin-dependent oxidoreductase YjgC|nr:hypothetical protein [Rubrivivax sp.]